MKGKGSGRLSIAAFVAVIGLLGLWLVMGKAKPPQPIPAAFSPRIEPRAPRSPDEPVAIRDASLSGFVRSADGKAIENARVCATTVRSEVSWTPALTCATTNQRGSYRIAPLEGTVYAVSAVAQGFRPAAPLPSRDILLGRGEAKTGVDIILSAGGARLSGHVVDATGGPISGAKIRVLRRVVPHDTTVTSSGPDGSFAAWVATGPVTVLAEAPEYASLRVAHVAPSSDLVLRLTPGSTVSGRVIAARTGAPVPGVQVRAISPGSWNDPTRPSATSDSDGAFEIRGLEPGRYALVGEGLGWRGELKAPVEVGLARATDGVTLTVSTAAVVAGKVVRRGGGEPCPRGKITLGPVGPVPTSGTVARPTARSVPMIVAMLEADGAVRVAAVPAGSYEVDVQCADFRLAEGPTTLEVGRDNIDGLVWKVDPGARVMVRALDGSDQPAANVRLALREGPPKDDVARSGDGRRPPPLLSFMTSAEGTYEVTGLSPGLYTVEPAPEYKGLAALVDARGSDKTEATVHLEGRGRIVVTVRTPEGMGVDQIEVRAAPAGEVVTSPSPERTVNLAASGASSSGFSFPRASLLGSAVGDGRFEIGPLAAGAYRVTASDGINPPTEPSDWPEGTVRVGAGVARATVVLRRSGALTGRVVDSSGQALPDLWVTADCTASAGAGGHRAFARIPLRPGAANRTISDQEGRFRIDRIASDARCTLRAEQPGGGGTGLAKDVRAGDDTVITVAELGSLSGTAKLPDGTPVTSFQLSVRDPGGVMRTETVTATDGRWSLLHVVPGRMQVLAFEPSLGAAQARVDLAPGERRDGVELQFRPSPGDRQP